MAKKAIYAKLLRDMRQFFELHGRSRLPWRRTRDPYRILVSEIMLQQTQVDRVVPRYLAFIAQFPTAQSLAQAPLAAVLAQWQGLGYNRRAKYLREAAAVLAAEGFTGQKLPGVGPYTRGAVLAFAYNKPEVFVETNIRTVLFYSGILKGATSGAEKLRDSELLPIVGELLALSRMEPRDFYAALMDYGSYLKRQGIRLNSRSAHYAKQSKFEGSARQLRGALLRELLSGPASAAALIQKLSRSAGEVERELTRLRQEGLVLLRAGKYRIEG